jgi:RHS repeat-associated protein
MGRILTEKRNIGSATAYIYYTYNKDGSLATLQTPPQKTITYTVAGAGRAVSAVDSGDSINFVTGATYAPPGELQTLTYGGAINGALAYNNRLQPEQMFYGTNTAPAPSGMTTACPSTVGNVMNKTYNFSFGAGDNGNVQSITNCVNTARSQSFTYDALNRIETGQSSGPQWGETYTIDPWGNLTNRGGISGKTYSEPLNAAPATPRNQLTGFGYDAAGNMITNASTTYIYDDENRLVWTSQYKYVYDADGNRVEKCEVASVTTACPVSGTTGTLYWRSTNGDPLDESNLGGSMIEDYIFFNGTRIARRDVSTDAVHYYFSDQVGSHSVVANAAGTTLEQDIDYYPYGGVEEDYSTAPVAQHYKFTGKERDTESMLDNFGARFDSSNLGRFMTPDWAAKPTAVPYAHFGNPQSLNLYSYVENNPTTLGDLDGHCPVASWLSCAAPKVAQALADAESSMSGTVSRWMSGSGLSKSTHAEANILNQSDKDRSVGLTSNVKIAGASAGASITLDPAKGKAQASIEAEVHAVKTEMNFSSNSDGKGAVNGTVTNDFLTAQASATYGSSGFGVKAEAQAETFGGTLSIGSVTLSGSVCAVCVGAQAKFGSGGASAGLESGLVGADFSVKWGGTTVFNKDANAN